MILGPMKGVDGNDGWGNPGIRLTDSQVFNYVIGCINLGASCLIDQCIYPNGSFEAQQYGQMLALHTAIKNAPPVSYVLTVSNGSGSGSYTNGAAVAIVANTAPAGQVFDRWVINSGSPLIANVSNATTTITMGASPAAVTATYKNAPPMR